MLGVLRPGLAPHPGHPAHPLPGGGQGGVPLRGARPGPGPRYYYVQTAVTRATIPTVMLIARCVSCAQNERRRQVATLQLVDS